jgi:hypothetical protein
MAVIEETLFARDLASTFESLQTMIGRFEESLKQARRLGPHIRGRFGGQQFATADWMLLASLSG